MKKLILVLAIFLTFSTWAESKITADDLPPWLKPELLVHISAMQMNDKQNIEFRESLTECLTGLQKVVQREIRKGGVNIPKRIQRGINREYSRFDDRMREALSEQQHEPWSLYFEGLKVVMAERAASR